MRMDLRAWSLGLLVYATCSGGLIHAQDNVTLEDRVANVLRADIQWRPSGTMTHTDRITNFCAKMNVSSQEMAQILMRLVDRSITNRGDEVAQRIAQGIAGRAIGELGNLRMREASSFLQEVPERAPDFGGMVGMAVLQIGDTNMVPVLRKLLDGPALLPGDTRGRVYTTLNMAGYAKEQSPRGDAIRELLLERLLDPRAGRDEILYADEIVSSQNATYAASHEREAALERRLKLARESGIEDDSGGTRYVLRSLDALRALPPEKRTNVKVKSGERSN